MRFPTKVVLGSTVAVLAIGCGIIIGNPGNPAEGTDTNENFVQTVDYDIPGNVAGTETSLDAPPQDGIFLDSARRTDKTIEDVNEMIDRLNHDAVQSVGDFTGKGLDQLVSGSITELTDNASYNYKAVICYKGAVFQIVEWSSVTGSVHTIRNHAVDPVNNGNARDLMSEIVFTKDTDSSIDVWMVETSSADKVVPGADGNIIADHTSGTKNAEGIYTLSGVHNWFTDIATINDEGDEYFAGTFNEAGVGENVTYNGFARECTTPFDESASVHTWCGGRVLPNGPVFSDAERAAAAERLKDIPVPSKTTLKKPAIPDGLTCPS